MHTDTGTAAVKNALGTNPNRPATADDAQALGACWNRLNTAAKAHTKAISDYRKALATSPNGDADGSLGEHVDSTSTALRTALFTERRNIADLPNGTTFKGANRQTVVMEFYGAVNRELGKRLTTGDARKTNTAAFGG